MLSHARRIPSPSILFTLRRRFLTLAWSSSVTFSAHPSFVSLHPSAVVHLFLTHNLRSSIYVRRHSSCNGSLGIHHQNSTSVSSALHGLRKLGASLDDLLPSSALSASSSRQSGRLKKGLGWSAGLRAVARRISSLRALNQLCDMLSIGTEDSLGSIAMDSFVPVFVGLLNYEGVLLSKGRVMI